MKDYLIWCGYKLEKATGWCWEKCMAICTGQLNKYQWLFEPGRGLSFEDYLRENS